MMSTKKKMVKLLSILFFVQCATTLHPQSAMYQKVFTYHNDTASKAEFAYNVVEKVYEAFQQWVFTIFFHESTHFENSMLKYTEMKNYCNPVLIFSGCASSAPTKVKPQIDKHGATTYIITFEELSSVNDDAIGALIRCPGVFKPRSPLIVVLSIPVDVDSNFYYDMQRHFQLLWSKNITNSVLILRNEKLRVYTYNVFFNKVKDITDVKGIESYLSRQYNNLNGHQLRLSVYRRVYLTDETGPLKCDSILEKTVMSFLNASCLPLMSRDGNTVGDLLGNGTATGVTGDLLDGYTDLELNSRILRTTYYGYIDTAYPLTNNELCFMIKKAEKQSVSTSILNLISSNILVLCLSSVVILITIAIITQKMETRILSQNQQTNGSTLMDLIKCFLKQTADIKYLGPVFRFLVFMIISYSLVMSSVIDVSNRTFVLNTS